jgi:Helix-turn-helix domain
MKANKSPDDTQPAKQSAFSLMKSVRDHCEQSDAKKVLLFTLATYCDGDGICWPGNETLIEVTRKGKSTVQRMLRQLRDDGELEVLASGAGRGQKRIIRLTRYVSKGVTALKRLTAVSAKGVKAVKRLNVSDLPSKARSGTAIDNSHEQPSDGTALRNSVPAASAEPDGDQNFAFLVKGSQSHASGSSVSGSPFDRENWQSPIQQHPKWPEFIAHAKRKGRPAPAAWFWSWHAKQKRQWKGKAAPAFDGEPGQMLNGNFLTDREAEAMAIQHPELLDQGKFRKAIRRADGTIQIIQRNLLTSSSENLESATAPAS